MIPIKIRTEFSFRHSTGKYKDVFNHLKDQGHQTIAITDRNSTFGHYKWQKLCEENDIKPLLGVELGVTLNPMEQQANKDKGIDNYMTFIARNEAGLKEIYEMVSLATSYFYYVPRFPAEELSKISDNIVILAGNNPHWDLIQNLSYVYIDLHKGTSLRTYNYAKQFRFQFVAVSDNNFIEEKDRGLYQVICGREAENKPWPQHIQSEDEWRFNCKRWDKTYCDDAIMNSEEIANLCNARIPQAVNVKPIVDKTLHEQCIEGAKIKNIDLKDSVYKARFEYEMKMIKEKDFEDYFLLVGDLISYSKKHMAIGPARGSSAGSLVCYLCDITEIDPIPYGLLFERFMAPDRYDPPDIDTDFEDERREMAFRYLEDKYGDDCVARIGTVSVFKPKSALIDASKILNIPLSEINDCKDSIIERSSADARASLCLKDTLDEMDAGKRLLKKYPKMAIACEMEGHARHHGQHAAGILVTEKPITNYCAIDMQTGAVMLDKKDVEALGMLKIDALGLRTLTIIRETLEANGLDMSWLYEHGTKDNKAINLLNEKKYNGIFQWEGNALQSITAVTKMRKFNDLISMTALSRPGPLQSGGTEHWLMRNNGTEKIEYSHPMLEPITKDTLGVVVYQEQILRACNEIGLMSWEETTALRKAMSESLGEEFFSKFEEQFVKGAIENETDEENARELFKAFCTFGSWSFNKSHAVSYGLVSYWTCVLKYHYLLDFFAANLRHAKDQDQTIKILREMIKEGYQYVPFDKEKSSINWSVKEGIIYGGLTNIKGIAAKVAHDIEKRRRDEKPLTARQNNLINNPITPFDDLFERKTLWNHIIDNPRDYNIVSKITDIKEIDSTTSGTFLLLAKITQRIPRDANELQNIKKRGDKKVSGPTAYLVLTIEDDTGQMRAQINRFKYKKIGDSIVQEDKIGDYYLFKGKVSNGFVYLHIERVVKLTGNEKYEKTLNN